MAVEPEKSTAQSLQSRCAARFAPAAAGTAAEASPAAGTAGAEETEKAPAQA
ncbi:hypothetical protein ACIF8T_32430 [Streptomyces sp. NPDC085946]|uniref:hypothetical protein n=1 Tax=Streptomyces sp. NPDC085946 TaxID=3365744 RepID=UPI0037D91826